MYEIDLNYYNNDNAEFNDNALKILEERYLQRDEYGTIIETPKQLLERVAWAVASAEKTEEDKEKWFKQFFYIMYEKYFLPNSPTLVNAGTDKGCLSACFVISPEDTMESIMKIASDAAIIEKWGGGIGFGLSDIRPKNDKISTTHGKALGPVAVMRIYAKIGQEITQGSFRLGAHMAQLHISHPDIREFIHCKDDVQLNPELSNFNISVQVPDNFMEAVEEDEFWSLINPRNGVVTNTVRARELWDELVESAHKTGDPGICFIDRIQETHPNPQLGPIKSSNPCGEEFIEDYNSCNLGSINLYEHFDFDNDEIEYSQLGITVRNAVRFLDNVVEINKFPLESLADMNKRTRRIGLGVMGFADVLMVKGYAYDSVQAKNLARDIGSFIYETAKEASLDLAKEKGAYPEFKNSPYNHAKPSRNSSITTIAPTGTISRLAGCSSGIEPFFALAHKSNILWKSQTENGLTTIDVPDSVSFSLIKDYSFGYKDIINDIVENPENVKNYNLSNKYRTAMDIDPESHVKMQSIWQKYMTNAVSKTVNLKNEATIEDVERAYIFAWETKCKGITIYRQGSREIEVLVGANKPQKSVENTGRWQRPEELASTTHRINTGHSNLYVHRGYDGDELREVFLNMGKSGGCENANMEAIGRLISLGLQYNVPVEEIVKQLSGITCCPVWDNGKLVKSPVDALVTLLSSPRNKDLVENKEIISNFAEKRNGSSCKSCGGELQYIEGCESCVSCGYSKCD